MENPSRRLFLAASAGALTARFSFAQAQSDLCALTLKQASEGIRAKKFSPVDLTEACLDSIKTWNPKINAWITVMREKALAQAKVLADEQSAGRIRGPLHGIPIGIKDSIDTAGVRTTAASAVYEYRFPSEDAEVVRRLKAAGAVLIGKANMHEFDAGASSAVSYWGPVRNPWNLERISGGPSGGSAAAVAMANCFAALGTDSNGGIRVPASDCGVTGLKATYGRVSLRGIVPFAWSLDHCGPLARTVADAALVLQQIAGYTTSISIASTSPFRTIRPPCQRRSRSSASASPRSSTITSTMMWRTPSKRRSASSISSPGDRMKWACRRSSTPVWRRRSRRITKISAG